MKNVLYIGNALSSQGNTVSPIESLSKHLKEFCEVNVASHEQNKIVRLFDMIASVWRLRRTAKMVLIDTYSTANFYYALIISQWCRILKISYIPILHGGQLENRLKYHPKKSAWIFKNAHQLVAPSKFLQTIFQSYGYDEVRYIPNTIALEKYTFVDREIETIKLLWVRSFSKIYNPALAIAVLEELESLGHKAELIMVGPEKDGSLSHCRTLAQRKQLKVKFTGLLPKEDWIKLSQSCNIFINTTNVDNTPVSVIEAMALGLPVVSTNVGGLPFLIENGVDGLLVPPNDAEALVKAILNLKNNSLKREAITQSARMKVAKFDWEEVKSQWQALLSSSYA
ncbi:glycosyltransferase family 4 protein [Winogradskyella aurantia]|uniref:Glycosyl transferase family 1 n=1 Tax=Winogradskyella aurantia TaxID=1915063 RepID=A0A265UQK9_9FLAO|nr:glycosyltransferase family 4 protein [Winogradskyella aurantia]OZV67590.1 glycosyl transferase family 1 [Winogradskyella aurantia]